MTSDFAEGRKLVLGDAGPTPFAAVLVFADAAAVVAAIPVSRFWAEVASSDEVWSVQCSTLWADKVHVPERFTNTAKPPFKSRISAYWESLADAKRSFIYPEELCSFEWSSRMKGWAGQDWTRSDPWWQDPPQPAHVKRYGMDGSTSSVRGNGTWKFVPTSCGQSGPLGSFVRHAREGVEFPTHFVSRWAPNWGWILQNCWGFSASFALPLRGSAPELEDDGELCQSVSVKTCHQEATAFNLGLPLPHSEDGDHFLLPGDDLIWLLEEDAISVPSSPDENWSSDVNVESVDSDT